LCPDHTEPNLPPEKKRPAPEHTIAEQTLADGSSPAPGAVPERAAATAPPSKPSKSADADAGRVFANRFEVVKLLGEGGMGRVYRVRDKQIAGREIALKILRPIYSRDERFRELFFQEIRAAQGFVSEHVVQVRDTGQMDDGLLFLTMDLVEGHDLTDLLGHEESLHERHALEITRQVLAGLESGHQQGFVHRDIKPSNVMMLAKVPKTDENPYGAHAQILDFGLANLAKNLDSGEVQGTPFYMSPEQVQGQRLDARSDLFAVGVMLYEMVSGTRPFAGATLREVTQSVIETDVDPLVGELDHLSPAVQTLLKKALKKDREKRFQSAPEFIKAIEGSKAYKVPRGVPVWVGAVTLLLAGAAAAEGLLLYSNNQDLVERRETIDLLRNDLQDAGTRSGADLQAVKNAALTDYDAAVARHSQAISDLTERHQGELDLKDGQYKTLNAAHIKLLDEKTAEVAESRAGDVHIADLSRDLTTLRDEVKGLRSENEYLKKRLDPQVKSAQGFDAVVGFVSEGYGDQARRKLEGVQGSGVLLSRGADGGEFLHHLVDAAEALYQYEHPDDGGIAASSNLERAKTSLATAQHLLGAFPRAASDWIDHDHDGQEPPPRLRAAEAALVVLGQQLATHQQGLTDEHDGAATQLLARAAESGPLDALDHQRRFSCDHVTDVTARFAAVLGDLQSNGDLDRARLSEIDALDEWGAAIASGEIPTDTPEGRAVLVHWLAKSWYGGGERAEEALWDRGLERVVNAPAEPTADWESELALRYALGRHADDHRLPPTHGDAGRAVFRYEDLESGRVSWDVEELGAHDSKANKWAYTRRRYSSDPLARVNTVDLYIERRGSAFHYAGGVLLDLRASSDGALVGGWSPKAPGALPSSLDIGPQDLERFAARVTERPASCLVVESTGKTLWISPAYGLVREEQPGVSSKELVYASSRRPN
jgi:hypothetical protein